MVPSADATLTGSSVLVDHVGNIRAEPSCAEQGGNGDGTGRGVHPTTGGRLTVLDLDSDVDPDVVYLGVLNGGRCLETASDLALCRGIFAGVWESATPLAEYL